MTVAIVAVKDMLTVKLVVTPAMSLSDPILAEENLVVDSWQLGELECVFYRWVAHYELPVLQQMVFYRHKHEAFNYIQK